MNLIKCYLTNNPCYKENKNQETKKSDTRYTVFQTQGPKGVLIHCTGANNPTLKRYVQPLTTDANYTNLINQLGKNVNNNDWNHTTSQVGVNAFIGKLADGTIATAQTMPWNYRPWGCGSGTKGSGNNTFVQFEICEDALTDKTYFDKVYKEAVQLTAKICKEYNIDPMGKTACGTAVGVPTILCHQDAYKYGIGSNHSDVYNWFNKFNKTMDDFRDDVKKEMNPTVSQQVATETAVSTSVASNSQAKIDGISQDTFNKLMDNYLANLANQDASSWAAAEVQWGIDEGLLSGKTIKETMPQKFITRQEMIALLHRLYNKIK